jgi:hypothetical protein
VEVEDDIKVFKLAREVARLGKLMSAGRDRHDIHTLHLVSFWESMPQATKLYTQHRLRLLYLASTQQLGEREGFHLYLQAEWASAHLDICQPPLNLLLG